MKHWIVAIVNIHRGARGSLALERKQKGLQQRQLAVYCRRRGYEMEIPVHMQVVASQSGDSPEDLPATLHNGATANWKEKAKSDSMQPNLHSAGVWTRKVVLITGASEGIGASCAKLFGQRGAKLSLTALPNEEFRSEEAASRLVIPGDITSKQTRIEVVERTIGHFGRIDVLINNAGAGQYGYPTEVDTEISKRIFDVNVFSALALTQLVVPHMRAQQSGSIVNIGSVGGKVSLPWAVMYCATKWALHCIDDSLRRELLGTGISVLKVCPGIVDTKFREHVLAGTAPGRVEDIRRVVSADQVARAVIRGLELGKRTVYVPKIGLIFTSLDFFAPRVMDWYLRSKF